MTHIHPQAEVRDFEVDEEIAPLIEALNGARLFTKKSCQAVEEMEGVPDGWIWIEFDEVEGLEDFLTVVMSGQTDSEAFDSLYVRMMGDKIDDSPLAWRYDVVVNDERIILDADGNGPGFCGGPCVVRLTVSVYFPSSDYDVVYDLVRATMED